MFEVNVLGVWHGCAVFGKRFVEQASPAHIVNVGSENSLGVPHLQAGAYTASKHAVASDSVTSCAGSCPSGSVSASCVPASFPANWAPRRGTGPTDSAAQWPAAGHPTPPSIAAYQP